MPDELLRQALAEQERELEKLDVQLVELRPLQVRRENLFHLISQIRHTLGMKPYTAPAPAPKHITPDPVDKRPIWEVAKQVIERTGGPMSPGDIAHLLRDFGYTNLEGRPGKETVRTLLNKKKDVFRKLADGRFEVIK